MHVYVINKHGEPLMPCKPRKARVLLQKGKATVVKRIPFTIQLLYGSSGYRQPITLGMDAGSKYVGIIVNTTKEVLYQEELQPRNDVIRLLSVRRQNRRARRNRKTRYREARFNNRVHSKHKGWLAPSVENEDSGTYLRNSFEFWSFLRITKVRVENSRFDTQNLRQWQKETEYLLVRITS